MRANPTHVDLVVFQAKATILRALRLGRDLTAGPRSAGRKILNDARSEGRILSESRSDLWDQNAPAAERVLQAGKVQNLRMAARRLDGLELPVGATFSFWRQVGFPGRRRGYVRGRELRQGCLIPTTGGGLCQLSNALYDAALKAGFEIVERHAHTQVIPGSLAESGRDATVFWNYVDLRFRAQLALRLRVDLTSDELIVQFTEVA